MAKGEKVGLITYIFTVLSHQKYFSMFSRQLLKNNSTHRTKEPGAGGDPLYLDIKICSMTDGETVILAGRYGLSSKDTTPGQVLSVFENMKYKESKDHFTVGLVMM